MARGEDVAFNSTRSSAQCFTTVFVDGRQRPAIKCSTCETISHHGSSMSVPGARLAKNFRNAGWQIDSKMKGATCPGCQEKDQVEKKNVQSKDAIIAQQKLFGLLEEHFDKEKKRYRGKADDKWIAKECGLSLDHVITVREALHGPLIDPELAKAEAQLDAMQAKLATLEQMVKEETAALRTDIARLRGVIQSRIG
jgi:hypothetical protein